MRIVSLLPSATEIVCALVEGHAAAPTERGYLRAISGMNRALRGGIDRQVTFQAAMRPESESSAISC